MSDFKIIFVSGVHGVGKSTFCSRINQIFGLPFYSASSLIKELKNSAVDVNKQVIDAEENQDYLIIALNNLKPQSETILLDGHFCLLGDKEVIDIPIKTFKSMQIKSILALHDFPETIHQRLLERDGKSLSIETINELQTRELELAEFTSFQLGVKLQTISHEQTLENLDWIEMHM
ncbi:hypothetical protein JCM14076_29480 [Methylosoma difficile]